MTVKNQLDEAFASYQLAIADGQENAEPLYTQLKQLASFQVYDILHRSDPELAHDAAVDLLLKLAQFRGESRFSTWAFTVLRRHMLMARRKERRFVDIETVSTDDPALVDGYDPQSETLMRELEEGLEDRDRELLDAMRAGVSLRELSRELGVQPMVLWRRAKRMKQRLEADYSG